MTASFFPGQWLYQHAPAVYRVLFGWIQFPFRYNTVLTLLLVLLFLRLYDLLYQRGNRRLLYGFLCAVLILSLSEDARLLLMSGNGRPVAAHEGRIADAGEYDDDLYLFYGLDKESVNDDTLRMTGTTVGETARKGFSFTLTDVRTQASGTFLELPLWYYEGYSATDGGGNSLTLTEGTAHRVRILLPEGFVGEVYLRYAEPLLWRAAELISVLCAILFLICGVARYRGKSVTPRNRQMT